LIASYVEAVASAASLRLGWQIPWATQGQLVMALKHSNIPELTELNLEYPGFAYGGPLNIAALAGQVDVLLTADQPAVALLARNRGFKLIARLMYNRTCVYVPPDSRIRDMAGLGGAKIAGPVGAAAERTMLRGLVDSGVDPAKVQFSQLDMAQQTVLLRASADRTTWRGIDALYGFDPLVADFEVRGLARMIDCRNVVSLVLAAPDMLTKRRDELERFLSALQLAWWIYSNNPAALDQLFLREAGLDVSTAALRTAAQVEPNWSQTDMAKQNLVLSETDFMMLDEAAAFLHKTGTAPATIDLRQPEYYDPRVRDAAQASGRANSLREKVHLD
jgi:ABC-type nitrate/sulfonate/bicarbonate transport system substrate-binding protein